MRVIACPKRMQLKTYYQALFKHWDSMLVVNMPRQQVHDRSRLIHKHEAIGRYSLFWQSRPPRHVLKLSELREWL